MKINRVCILVFLVLNLFWIKAAYSKSISIYYIPIGVETYLPVDEKTIVNSYNEIINLSMDSEVYRDLMLLLHSAPKASSYSNDAIRVKIVLNDNDAIFIDNYGGIKIENNFRKLTIKSLTLITHYLHQLSENKVGKITTVTD